MKEKLWKVEVEDLSHLGGPMGSEYTTTIDIKWFKTYEGAFEWMKKDAKKRKAKNSDDGWEPYINEKNHKTWDCLSIGYDFQFTTLEIGE
jgi:hypothetical protein